MDKLDTTIRGNGKEGLKTQVALNRQAIKRMWWAVGGVFLALGPGWLLGALFKSTLRRCCGVFADVDAVRPRTVKESTLFFGSACIVFPIQID